MEAGILEMGHLGFPVHRHLVGAEDEPLVARGTGGEVDPFETAVAGVEDLDLARGAAAARLEEPVAGAFQFSPALDRVEAPALGLNPQLAGFDLHRRVALQQMTGALVFEGLGVDPQPPAGHPGGAAQRHALVRQVQRQGAGLGLEGAVVGRQTRRRHGLQAALLPAQAAVDVGQPGEGRRSRLVCGSGLGCCRWTGHGRSTTRRRGGGRGGRGWRG